MCLDRSVVGSRSEVIQVRRGNDGELLFTGVDRRLAVLLANPAFAVIPEQARANHPVVRFGIA